MVRLSLLLLLLKLCHLHYTFPGYVLLFYTIVFHLRRHPLWKFSFFFFFRLFVRNLSDRSWNMEAPKAHMQANAKYISYNSFEQSDETFSGVSRQSSKWQSIWMWAMSGIGVIFLNRFRTFSIQEGMYLSKRITKFVLSAGFSLVSNQLVTYLKNNIHNDKF